MNTPASGRWQAAARPTLAARAGIFDKLKLMRWLTGHLWALAAGLALIVVLAFTCQPGFVADSGAGMSAPPAPRTSVESAPVAKLLQAQFDWCGYVLLPAGVRTTLTAARAADGPRQHRDSVSQCYGPLHRRPPPSFS